jgi:transcriptional regulator with XRE-family HTH domain
MSAILVNMTEEASAPLAANLRSLRRARGLSIIELARRSSVSRATLSQLEAGGGNPTLETLYDLANALDASLAELITGVAAPEPPRVVRAGEGPRVLGDAVEAWLLHTVATRTQSIEIYDFRLHTALPQSSGAHSRGTREHLHVYTGRIRVGPVSNPVELAAGDFVAFDADQPHVYQRVSATEFSGLLVITHAER